MRQIPKIKGKTGTGIGCTFNVKTRPPQRSSTVTKSQNILSWKGPQRWPSPAPGPARTPQNPTWSSLGAPGALAASGPGPFPGHGVIQKKQEMKKTCRDHGNFSKTCLHNCAALSWWLIWGCSSGKFFFCCRISEIWSRGTALTMDVLINFDYQTQQRFWMFLTLKHWLDFVPWINRPWSPGKGH